MVDGGGGVGGTAAAAGGAGGVAVGVLERGPSAPAVL